MQKRLGGQSLVEMAFVLPVLLLVIFGIIDMGYYVYGYATVAQASRNGAEVAAQLPPFQDWLALEGHLSPPDAFDDDPCVNAIYRQVESDATLFTDIANYVEISYPNDTSTHNTRNLHVRGPIEVTIEYDFTLLTPLSSLVGFGNDGQVRVKATTRRSLENLGSNPDFHDGMACAAFPGDVDPINP
ncbi:MAG: pilus assembly protein [Chloroflexales bacterium]|nr:pilus assembly protein [Chloroflexales bacterium]